MAVLEVHNLVFAYRAKRVLEDISFAVAGSEIVGLLGRNGAGKTTLFSLLGGFFRPESGRILVDGEDLTAHNVEQRAHLGLVYLPQKPSVLARATTEENLRVVAEFLPGPQQEEIAGLLRDFDLTRQAAQPVATLSGGERRKLEIARSLLLKPRFLLLDEPFAGLDLMTIDELCDHLRRLKDDVGVLICDHREKEVKEIATRVFRLRDGKLNEEIA